MSINDIPPELLGEIFCQCTATDAEAPLVLSTVCTYFRTVVCATPRAWAKLRLNVGAGPVYPQVRRAELWFRMAKECPMKVYVDVLTLDRDGAGTGAGAGLTEAVPAEVPTESEQSCPSVVSVLRSHVALIQDLALRSSSEALVLGFLTEMYLDDLPIDDLPKVMLDAVRRLTINISEDIPPTPSITVSALLSAPPQPTVITPFLNFPALSSLILTNHSLPCPSLLSNIHTFHFKRPLRAAPISVTDIFNLLRNAPQIVSLELECRTLNDQVLMEDDEPDDIVLHDLSRLSLRCNNIEQLLNGFVLPGLQSLSIDDLDSHSPDQHLGTALRGLIVRSALLAPTLALKHIELINVAMCPARRGRVSEDAATWEWCFNRMSLLESIAMTSSEGSEHLGLLNLLARGTFASSSLQNIPRGPTDSQGVVCQGLKRLLLSAPFVIDPFAASKFQECRPGVQLTLREVAGDVIPFAMFASFGPVDPLGPSGTLNKTPAGQGRRGGFGFGSLFDRRRRVKSDDREPS